MVNRHGQLSDQIPVWFFHGSNSFIDYTVAIEMTRVRCKRAPTQVKVSTSGKQLIGKTPFTI